MKTIAKLLGASAITLTASLAQASAFTITVGGDFNSDGDAVTESLDALTAYVAAQSIYTDSNTNGMVDPGEAVTDIGTGYITGSIPGGFGTDAENLNSSWGLNLEYSATGTAIVSGPIIAANYTSGTVNVTYSDGVLSDLQVLALDITSSMLVPGNFVISGLIDYSWYVPGGANDALIEAMFNFVDPIAGMTSFYDIWAANPMDPIEISFRYDTNVDLFSVVPTADDCVGDFGADALCRSAELDGSVRFSVPEPASVALLGIGLLGLGGMARKKSSR